MDFLSEFLNIYTKCFTLCFSSEMFSVSLPVSCNVFISITSGTSLGFFKKLSFKRIFVYFFILFWPWPVSSYLNEKILER